MNKLILLGMAATLGAAKLAFFPANPPVDLQPTSPGTAQTGHLNITGTATVGLLKSAGTVFGQASSPTGISYGGFFTAASNQARGFYGYASSPSGLTYGGFFQNASTSGRAVYGLATATSGNNFGGYFQTASTAGRGVLGVAASASGTTYGIYGKAVSPSGYGVYSEGNMHATGKISSDTSVNVATTAVTAVQGISVASGGNGIVGYSFTNGVGVMGMSTATTGYGLGVAGTVYSPTGSAVSGVASNNTGSAEAIGVRGASESPAGYGVLGIASSLTGINYGVCGATNSSIGYGVIGRAANSSGIAIYSDGKFYSNAGVEAIAEQKGGDFTANGPGGQGVVGTATLSSGATTGVLGDVLSTGGTGVWARSSAGTGTNYALRATSVSTGGYAGHFTGAGPDTVYIQNTGAGRGLQVIAASDTAIWGTTASGVAGVDGRTARTDGFGVWGKNFGTTGASYGVAGSSDSSSGFGLYAFGNSGASGTKSFRIDHPFNPDKEYLLHYSAEGPEPLNVYTGNVTTDASGSAWVQLPDYFGEINKDFRYTLTVVDDTDSDQFVMAKVAREIRDNKFKIRTNAPKIKVTWRVEGVRNDLWVRKYGAPVEKLKEDREIGKYQHPELYGKPKELGIDYRPAEPATRSQGPKVTLATTKALPGRRTTTK